MYLQTSLYSRMLDAIFGSFTQALAGRVINLHGCGSRWTKCFFHLWELLSTFSLIYSSCSSTICFATHV